MRGMKTKVYFDGACHLCSREIEHYRPKAVSGRVEFIDIASPGFSAIAEGLDPVRVNREMHVRDENGELHYGVGAFIQLWKTLPGYSGWARIAEMPGIHQVLQIGYRGFAALRPFLPKRKVAGCDTGSCHR